MRSGKRPTQADVARLAAVSQPVVSYVLSGDAAAPVASHTRQRVLAAIEELGYTPDRAARSLRTRKTFTIASVIPDITNPFYPAFERGIQDVADDHGYDLITYNTDGSADKEARFVRLLRQGRVDGVVGIFFHLKAGDLRPLIEDGIAVVRLEAGPREVGPLALDNLYVDNAAAARDLCAYLIARGHRRIGMITGPDGPRQARALGYERALAEAGIERDGRLVTGFDFKQGGGYDAMRRLLGCRPEVTAVFAANDVMAVGAMLAIREAGRRVPDDIAVAGFDDIPLAALVDPPLTTVAQAQERLGRRAAEMLVERFAGVAPRGGRCEAMPYELMVRASA